MMRGRERRRLPPWLVGTLVGTFALQAAVTMARPLSTYRLLALDAGGGAVGLTAASFAVPPMLLSVWFGRWTERRHPAHVLVLGIGLMAPAIAALALGGSVGLLVLGTVLLGIGHMAGAIGGQSIMAQADTSVPRLTRFGVFTTTSALGQVVGPVLAGVLIGQAAEPELESTTGALWVAVGVVALGIVPALGGLRTRIKVTTVRQGRPQRVWSLLRVRGMTPALMTSFSAKGAADLLLVYLPILGLSLGLHPGQIGLLLGLSSVGAMAARASTPLLVRGSSVRSVTTRATAVAALCVLLLPFSDELLVLIAACVVLGYMLGLTQTTTMDWVVGLVDHTSRGSALGLRLATNRLGQAAVLAAAGVVTGVLGVEAAFIVLGGLMLATAVIGAFRGRPESGPAHDP
jgi:predicted MFS family arabinose efflux permease